MTFNVCFKFSGIMDKLKPEIPELERLEQVDLCFPDQIALHVCLRPARAPQ